MNIILSADDLETLTGYRTPKRQEKELHRRGFYRARISPTTGNVILERAHYDAVCAGEKAPKEPTVRNPFLRLA